MRAIDLRECLSRIERPWDPHVVAELNGQHVRLAKLHGEFLWHAHADEDELFLVLEGRLEMQFRDRRVQLGPGQMLVVPRGVEHRPVAAEEVQVLLFEPAATVNTGTAGGERTLGELKRL
jgi:mannose-6-phosphate isomerase-like protein (cupin superfamily)